MKELDVVLERYVRSHLSEATAEERRVLACLLELSDPDLADCLLGPRGFEAAAGAVLDPKLADLIAAIRNFTPPGAQTHNVGGSPEL